MPRAILFDMGNTITGECVFDEDAGREVMLMHPSLKSAPRFIREQAWALYNQIRVETYERARVSCLEFDFRRQFKLLCGCLGVDGEACQEFEAQFYRAMFKYPTLEPGIREVLDDLGKLRIAAAVVSNSIFTSPVLRQTFVQHGIADRFRFVISSADYGVRKPDSRLFGIAARQLGFGPEDIWFVGDSAEADVKGALSAGMRPVLYNRLGIRVCPECCQQVGGWPEFRLLIA